jgi:predicted DCC family thiol-disulfide oxidoreductase YuxK
VILFDGVCNLCNASVQTILRHDHRGQFRFASLQSPVGRTLLHEHGLKRSPLGSVVLLEHARAYTRSRALARIARRIEVFAPAGYLLAALPPAFTDLVYDWIARNRYRWFGQRAQCTVPTPELRDRFLE